ncbi:MAG: ribosome silencing factor [Ruminococcaceae bacterium]|nr:ribosome silencing factor [Oscillospiraceae bacterium]
MINEKTNELSAAEADVLAAEAVKVLLEKLALEVTMYDVREHTSVTDFYVNATGKSSTHVASLADDVVDSFESRGKNAYRVEGKRGNSWILVDFGSLIVNVFDSEARSFYGFDRLLPAECGRDISDLAAEVDAKFSISDKEEI